MQYFLIDNGSLRPGSVLQLRRIADSLSRSSGIKVRPFGLMHSHKVDSAELEGIPGESMEQFLLSKEAERIEEVRVLPFFLGPSLAITDWLPENLQLWKQQNPGSRTYRILDPLHRLGDDRLVRAVVDFCLETIKGSAFHKPRVAMVDHGTPLPEVNRVREIVGEEVGRVLESNVEKFSTCAMERRADPKYDFNDPTLETLLDRWVQEEAAEIVVSQFFLLPGRHAGPGGDLSGICQSFEGSGVKIKRTRNLGEHPLIEQILLDRIREDQRDSTS